MIIYTLYDAVAQQFTPVFQQPTKAACIRAIKNDQAIMASLDDFYIVEIAELQSLENLKDNTYLESGVINFSKLGVIRFSKEDSYKLKYFLGIKDEKKSRK